MSTKQLLTLLLVLFPAVSAAQEGGEKDRLERAAALIETGNTGEAIRVLEKDRTASDASAPPERRREAARLLGVAYAAEGDPESASRHLEEAIAASPSPPDLALVLPLARAALEMHDGAAARRALELLEPASRREEEASLLAASALSLTGDQRAAEEAFRALHARRPSAPAAHALGVALYERGDFEAARAKFVEARRLAPGDYYSDVYLVRSLLALGRVEEAGKEIAALLASAPTAEVRYLLARTRAREGRWEEAVQGFQDALRESPGYAEASFGLGNALRRLGREEEARRALAEFERLHREEQTRQRRREALAQDAYRRPQDARAAEELGIAALDGGDFEGAEASLWKALRLDPTRAGARLALARALTRTGRYRQGAVQYQKILRQNPGAIEARRELEALVREHARTRP
jgi:tetratricopeptide (TPR) repeat protein